MIHFNPL